MKTLLTFKNCITLILNLYIKSCTSVSAIVGDICTVNKALANMVTPEFVGCSTHRFKMSVQDVINANETLINLVNRLMKILKSLVPAAKLRKLTSLCAVTKEGTRCS